MIFDLIISAIFGLAAHQTRRITEVMPHGWQNLSEHAIGVLGLLVLWPHWYSRLTGFEHGKKRGWVSLALSALGFGIGVAAGWVADGERK